MTDEEKKARDIEEELDDDEEEDDDDDNGGRDGRSRSSRPKPRRALGRRPRLCNFCAGGPANIDYKQVDTLRRYITENGKMRNRRQSGNCAKHQRMVARAIKRARHMALLPYEGEVRR